jgi:hypothetical protein
MTPPFDTLVQDFFCRRLIEQQGVSPRTVEAYRDTFRLLLSFLPQSLGKRVPAVVGVYAHVGVFDQTAALDALPARTPAAPATGLAALPATGTDMVRFGNHSSQRFPYALRGERETHGRILTDRPV